MKRAALYLLLPFLLVTVSAQGQSGADNDADGAQGYANNIFHHSSVDSINLYNGQLTIPIPIGPSYSIGPKLKFQAVLTYNSRGPDISTNGVAVLAGDPALGMGWTFTLGAIKTCAVNNGDKLCYFAPDGSQHVFAAASFGYSKTVDATQLQLHDLGTGGPYEMWDGDGNHYSFSWHVAGFDDPSGSFYHDFGRGRDGWYLDSLADPFGNSMSVSYFNPAAAPCWTSPPSGYTCGCTSGSTFFPCTAMQCPPLSTLWIPQTITLPSGTISILLDGTQKIQAFQFPVLVNGLSGTATWTLEYQIDSQNPDSCTSNPQATSTVYKVSALRLPSDIPGAPSYQFSYASGYPPVLTEMILPTGGTVDYCWGDYFFYHGRQTVLGARTGLGPPSNAPVLISDSCFVGNPRLPQPRLPIDPTSPEARYEDAQLGVVQRTETVGGVPQTTDYTEYAFPFGEAGNPSSDCATNSLCTGQSLTVVLFPPDVDGRRRAKSVLFWSGPPGFFTYPGDRVGADLHEAVFDSDPRPPRSATIAIPVCGGPTGPNDQPFCPNHAVRVTFRNYEFETVTEPLQTYQNNRRLSAEAMHHAAMWPDESCPNPPCPFHTVTLSNLPGNTWDGNGRHYNVETHSGNLGNDSRQITTTWTPANWNTPPPFNAFSLPNLMSQRTECDGSCPTTATVNKFFEYRTDTTANGFLLGSALWDSNRQITFLSCFYNNGRGNVGQEFSATYSPQGNAPSNACQTNYPSFPSEAVGVNGDAFGKIHSYTQNGLLLNSRWMATPSSPAGWYLRNYVRDPATGWITSSRDTAGLTTSYSYDSLGRVTNITPPGGDAATAVSYPSTTQTIALRNAGIGLTTYDEYDYDGLGRVIRHRRLMPSSQYSKRFTLYDGAGHAFFNSEWVADSTPESTTADLATSCAFSTGSFATSRPSSAPGTYQLCYDPFGRPQQVVGSKFSSLVTVNRTDATWYSDTLAATTVGCVSGALQTSGACGSGGADATTTSRKDAWGRLTSVTEPGGDLTSYNYDVNGKLAQVVQDQQARTFTFDLAGFLRSEATPEKGTVSYDMIGSLGNVLSETQPGGLAISRTYDFAGRLTGVISGGQRYLTNCYDGGGCVDGNPGYPGGFYPSGKLTRRIGFNPQSASASSVTDDMTYSDPAGRLSSQTTAVAGGTSLSTSQGWLYNGLGLIAHHYHPRPPSGAFPFVVSIGYDAGLPVTEYANGIPMVKSIGYQASGSLASYTTGIGISDVTTTIAQDASLLPRPSSISTSGATQTFATGTFSYDGAGNVMAMGLDTFGYDSRSRLTTANLSSVGSQVYTYDRYGNLLSKAGSTFCSGTCTNNQISGAGYLRGNLTSYSGQTFTYDGLDRMTSNQASTTWSYLYDGADERIAKIPPSPGDWTFTIRDEAKGVTSEFAATTPSRDNVFLGNRLAVSYANAGVGGNGPVWVFYASDHLGTPRLLTDVTGGPVEPQPRRYWPYGEAATAAGSFQALRFATMELDAEAGTGSLAADRYYDHARSHVGGLGRFLSPDIIQGEEYFPQSWNRYSYAHNNPLRFLDPYGLSPEEGSQVGCGYEDEECTVIRPGSHQESITVKPPSLPERLVLNGVLPYLSLVTGSNNDPVQLLKDVTLIGLNASGPLLKGLPVGLGIKHLLPSALTVTFKHGALHLIERGLAGEIGAVEAAITSDLTAQAAKASVTGEFWGRVLVNGREITYRAYTLAEGVISVGTYTLPR